MELSFAAVMLSSFEVVSDFSGLITRPTVSANLDNLSKAFDWLDGGDVILGRDGEYFLPMTALTKATRCLVLQETVAR